MKKFILPLLLLLFVGSIMAVESEPSAVVGYVKYNMVAGDNFVAMPMVQPIGLTSEFGAQFGEDVNTIYIWNQSTQTWDPSVNYGGGFWDPDIEVGTNSQLFLNANTALTYYSIGELPETPATFNIVQGDNTVMIPLNNSDLVTTALAGSSMGDGETVNTIYVWNTGTQTWDPSVNYGGGFWDPEMETYIGQPLFLNSGSDFVWPSRSAVVSPLRKSTNK